MRVAWFRASSSPSAERVAAMSAVMSALGTGYAVDIITEARAHDFVVEQALRPYDTCVFEIRNAPGNEFIWAYLFQYPGVFVLQDRSLHDSRVRALERHRRSDAYARELRFNHAHAPRAAHLFPRGSWPMLRAPLHASRVVVVLDEQRRLALESAHPGVRVRTVPPCAAGPTDHDDVGAVAGPLRIEAIGRDRRAVVERAVARAREAGAPLLLTQANSSGNIGQDADVVVALDSPAEEPELASALAAMARRKTVIVLEREATAQWPALDPQTWRPRDLVTPREPVVISIDPRDEEHSLMRALVGLARDDSRRRAIGAAARAWWQANATPEHAAAAWRAVLDEAATTPAPARPVDWPAHLDVDGAEQARLVAAEMGIALPELV